MHRQRQPHTESAEVHASWTSICASSSVAMSMASACGAARRWKNGSGAWSTRGFCPKAGADGGAAIRGEVETRAELPKAGAGVIGTDRTGREIVTGGAGGEAWRAGRATETGSAEDATAGAEGAGGLETAARTGRILETTGVGTESTDGLKSVVLSGGGEGRGAERCSDAAAGGGFATAAGELEVIAAWALGAGGGVITTMGSLLLVASACTLLWTG